MAHRPVARLFCFNSFELDVGSGELWLGGKRLSIQPQPFKVLALLAARSGEVVTREEIRQQVWGPETFVDFKSGLNFCIRLIRKALGENPKRPRFIETLHGRGYRFIAEVRLTRNRTSSKACAVNTPDSRLLNDHDPQRPVTLAILPLRGLCCEEQAVFLADAITELLTTYLSINTSLRVVSSTTAKRYKNTDKSLPRIAKELRVDRVLEGEVAHSEGQVRLTVRLIDPSTDQSVWASCYETQMRAGLEFQDLIASAVTRDAVVCLTPQDPQRNILALPVVLESNAAQGRYYLNRRTERDLNRAVECFNRAVTERPDNALAYAGLSDAYVLSYCYCAGHKPKEMYAKAKAAARKALQLDVTLAEAHAALAYCNMLFEWDWNVAESGFRRALELNPKCIDALQWYADLLTVLKRHDEAIERIQLASELDPLSDQLNANVGWVLLYANRTDQAIEQFQRALEMNGNFFLAHWGLGLAYAQAGMFPKAVDSVERAIEVTERMPSILAALAGVYAKSGKRKNALQVFSELRELATHRYVSAYDMAAIASSLGDLIQATSWLERACGERSSLLSFIQVDPRFSHLSTRSSPAGGDVTSEFWAYVDGVNK